MKMHLLPYVIIYTLRHKCATAMSPKNWSKDRVSGVANQMLIHESRRPLTEPVGPGYSPDT